MRNQSLACVIIHAMIKYCIICRVFIITISEVTDNRLCKSKQHSKPRTGLNFRVWEHDDHLKISRILQE